MDFELSAIKEKLMELHRQAADEFQRLVFGESPELVAAGSNVDRGEAARATEDFTRRVALGHQQKNHLAAIERALSKIENGSYGLCDTCNNAIGSDRLEIIPYASQCMKCNLNRAGCQKK